jgi:hypothetical protein
VKSSRTVQWIVTGIAWLLFAVAAGLGSMAYTIFHKDGPKAPAAPIKVSLQTPPAQHSARLSDALVPYNDTWAVGEDLGQFGSGGDLTHDQVVQLLQQETAGLGSRDDFAATLDRSGWKATAFRMYRNYQRQIEVRIDLTQKSPAEALHSSQVGRQIVEAIKAPVTDQPVPDVYS